MEIKEYSDRIEVTNATFRPSVSPKPQVLLDPLILATIKAHTSGDEEKIRGLFLGIDIEQKNWIVAEVPFDENKKNEFVVTFGVWAISGKIELYNGKTKIICKPPQA